MGQDQREVKGGSDEVAERRQTRQAGKGGNGSKQDRVAKATLPQNLPVVVGSPASNSFPNPFLPFSEFAFPRHSS